MKHQWEKQMQQLTEKALVSDIIPGFDKEALWEHMEQSHQLPVHKKRQRIALGWVSHAAAVVAGMLIASLVLWLYKFQPETMAIAQPVVPAPPQVAGVPAARPHTVTVPVLPPPVIANTRKTVLPVRSVMPGTSQSQSPGRVPPQDQQPDKPVADDAPVMPEPLEPVVTQRAPRKVVHYLDITSETGIADKYEREPTVHFVQIKINKPEALNSTQQQTPFRELVRTLTH